MYCVLGVLRLGPNQALPRMASYREETENCKVAVQAARQYYGNGK